jgi:hypothetical protein
MMILVLGVWAFVRALLVTCCSRLSALSSLRWRGYKPDAAGLAR